MDTIFTGLKQDIRDNLKQQLFVYWTYSSNAIEGNSLTLGETDFIIREGLTIAGKPLQDHKDAEAHYNAVKLTYRMLSADALTEQMLFDLHRAIYASCIVDADMPHGAWKKVTNGTYVFNDATQRSEWIEYPDPAEVPALMKRWLLEYNHAMQPKTKGEAVSLYTRLHTTFVSIHPFCDGNGRIARLVANIPVLKAGYPPIMLAPEHRHEYIRLLSKLSQNGKRTVDFDLQYPELERFIAQSWEKAFQLVQDAKDLQMQRSRKSSRIKP